MERKSSTGKSYPRTLRRQKQLNEKSVAELIKLAKDLDLNLPEGLSKIEIINALSEHRGD